MALFKSSSSKNQALTAASPSQTPRSSMHESRPSPSAKMTPEQALNKLMHITMGDAAAGPYIR